MYPVTTTTAEWLLEISGLTVGNCTDDIVSQGHQLGAQVRGAAAAFRSTTTCGETVCAPGCPLHAYDGGASACRLAAALAPDAHRPSVMDAAAAQRSTTLYIQAIRAASTAVFHCRRQAHVTGVCWFAVTDEPLCGDILAVAHRMGD